jgi:hypothetical protein
MKVNPEQAIRSIIAYKDNQRKQSEHEDKLMFELIKNRKEFDKKQEDRMIKASGLKKKDLDGIRKGTKKNFAKSLEAFKKIRRPEKEPAQQLLSRYADAHNKPGAHAHPHPRPEPDPQSPQGGDDTQAICFASAIRCEGKFCERENAAIFPVFESDSVGGYFGNIATAVPANLSNSLYYLFVPSVNGTATILAEVLLTGVISAHTAELYALNFFFPIGARSTADVKFSLRMNVWQGTTIINTTELPIVDISCRDGESKFLVFRNDLFILATSTIVTQEEWIVIEIMAVANLVGRSHVGIAVVDFGKGQKLVGGQKLDFGTRVPQLCVFVNPL